MLLDVAHGALVEVEIYPREGTETSFARLCSSLAMVEIYPREGTETSRSLALIGLKMLKFIPVRGRKPAVDELMHGKRDG